MASLKTVSGKTIELTLEKQNNATDIMVRDLLKASIQSDGDVLVGQNVTTLKLVDIADVDLLLTFANGEHVVIVNGALDALSGEPENAIFSDEIVPLSELFKLVGIASPAKSGSLRLVSENIDAADAPQHISEQLLPSQDTSTTAPPAPTVKVGAGTSSSDGLGRGTGEGEGEVPATVVPLATPQPTVYRAGTKTQQTIEDLLNGTGLGQPNVSQLLFTSSEFKVTPSGRADLPLGSYDPNASSAQLEVRSSPEAQSTREVINGTSGVDNIGFNSAFSTGEGQWSKTLHVTVNNFSDLNSIQMIFNPAIAGIAGFDVQGTGITRDTPTSNSWHVAPTADMLLNGFDVHLVYDVNDSAAAIDFAADLVVNGFAGPLAFEVTNNLNFSWRDAISVNDFTVTSSTGAPLMVLPRAGVGVEVFAGGGADVVNTGAGRDLIHGGSGNDTLNGGAGNDVLDGGLGADTLDGGQGVDAASYENSTTGVTATLDGSVGLVNTNEAAGDSYVNIENLTGSDFNDILVGDAQANVLTAGTGDDTLVGRGNGDTLDGGDGNDTASYEYAISAVTVDLANGVGTQGEADGDTLISIENVIGGAGDDTFISALGLQSNSYDGQAGADLVSYANSTENVVASLTLGLPGVAQINDAAGDSFTNIENLTGTNYNDTLIGNSDDNVLDGGNGDDLLEGLGGADAFIGGSGIDLVSYEHSVSGVTASLNTVFSIGPAVTFTNDAIGDTFSSIENLTGTSLNDTLIGNNESNTLTGGNGDDELEGLGGADTLIGGSGTDTATYIHSVTGVAASLTTGLPGFNSAGDAAGDTFQSIENLTGSEFNDILIGDANNNVLTGGNGDDSFEGFAGADTLIGGAGINTASYEHGTDQGAGLGVTASLVDPSINTGDASGDTYSDIQNLIGSAFDDTLIGDANNNVLTGGTGNDTLEGNAGEDQIFGGIGDDTITDDGTGAEVLVGGEGDDTFRLTSVDTIRGSIQGGEGSDTFVWDYAGNSAININMVNGTTYFYLNGGDRVNLTGIENITTTNSSRLYVYVDNKDNIITGANGFDYADYRYAPGGINVNLDTGIVTGASGNDTLISIDSLVYGSHYDDIIIGSAADEQIQGGLGADTMDGGAGYDMVRYDYYSNSTVTVSLMNASINAALGIEFTGSAKGDVLSNFERLYGSNYSDFLYGDGNNNRIDGNNGNDVIEGMKGADQLYGGNGTDTASYANAGLAAAGSATTAVGQGVTATLTTSIGVFNTGDAAGDTYNLIENLKGSTFDDVLVGNSTNNVIDGGEGNDVLEGLAGADSFQGGAGIDTVTFEHSTVAVIADLSSTVSGTNDAAGDTYLGIENITGSSFNDTLYGNGSDNILNGGLGTNTLNGRGGFDTASYLDATGSVTINLATNSVTGAGRTDTLVDIERVIGSTFNDSITGSGGDDWIDAGDGADTVNGGGGSDTLSYLSATGGVVATIGGVNSQGDVLTSIENFYGSVYGDILTGDAASNILEGGLGSDTLNGAGGSDTVSYAHSSDAVSVNISSSSVVGVAANSATGGEGNDTLSNFENITGSEFDDILVGDANTNIINGNGGNDVIIGGAGADVLSGGDGEDTVSYSNALAGISVTINGVGTSGDATGDTLSSIENIIGSAFNDTITGDSNRNVIDGGAGNDVINAGGGIDTVTYLTAASAVTVNLSNAGVNVSGGAGNDTLTNVENIIGSNFDDSITGNGGANTLEGGLGNDVLDGAGGTDTLSYEHATAGVSANISNASVSSIAANSSSGGAGTDSLSNFENLSGSAFNDTLIGTNLSNILDGGDGDDVLIGGAGADTLIGGLGIDTASYVNATSAVRATLGGAALTHVGDAVGDTFSGIESLTGSAYNDYLYGDNNNNVLIGGAGNDNLRGYDGNDIIDATKGFDVVYGGNGDDVIMVSANSISSASHYSGDGNTYNLQGGGDTIVLEDLVAGSYDFSILANETNYVEILDLQDTVATSLDITALDIQRFVDGGNNSQLWVKADAGDVLNFTAAAGETLQATNTYNGTDYAVFNSNDTQIAAVHWQTA